MKELQECGECFTGPSWLGESISRENEFSDIMPSECLKELISRASDDQISCSAYTDITCTHFMWETEYIHIMQWEGGGMPIHLLHH